MARKLFCVYRLSVEGSKHFYFGATSNMETRKHTHATWVLLSFRLLRQGRVLRNTRQFNLHYTLGKCLLKHTRKEIDVWFVKEKLCFDVVDIVNTAKKASALERKLIEDNRENKYILNGKQTSNYTYCNKKIKT